MVAEMSSDRLQEAVVLPLPAIEIQSEPISPTSEVPAPSEAATSEARKYDDVRRYIRIYYSIR